MFYPLPKIEKDEVLRRWIPEDHENWRQLHRENELTGNFTWYEQTFSKFCLD